MEVNMWWFENLYCDLDWWRKEMLGSVVIPDGEVCWDKVEFPGVAYSLFRSIEKDLPPWPADFDPYHYPEYKQCQEFGLSKTFYDGLCPFGGHIQSGVRCPCQPGGRAGVNPSSRQARGSQAWRTERQPRAFVPR